MAFGNARGRCWFMGRRSVMGQPHGALRTEGCGEIQMRRTCGAAWERAGKGGDARGRGSLGGGSQALSEATC